MSLFDLGHERIDKPQRSWVLETMIVVGLIAFGAFALFADSPSAIGALLNGLL
ncbi:MAG: hypothetical protein ABIO40_04125 [Devosia sp.]